MDGSIAVPSLFFTQGVLLHRESGSSRWVLQTNHKSHKIVFLWDKHGLSWNKGHAAGTRLEAEACLSFTEDFLDNTQNRNNDPGHSVSPTL